MNELSKQQLILLALLVSFVTSLATGIVTVSLMDQAPKGVAQSVTNIIERTIEAAVPQNAAVVTATTTFEDMTTDAVSEVSLSIVKLKGRNAPDIAGMGLVVSKSGVILADKATVAPLSDYDAIMPDGTTIPVAIVQSQIEGDIVFLAPSTQTSFVFSPVGFVSPQLGQTVFSISGTSSPELGQGIITKIPDATVYKYIKTSIPTANMLPGSALFNIKGQVIGVKDSSADSQYYPVKALEGVMPK